MSSLTSEAGQTQTQKADGAGGANVIDAEFEESEEREEQDRKRHG
jgi:hypothetical protein